MPLSERAAPIQSNLSHGLAQTSPRARIVEAAVEYLTEHGFHELPAAEVAKLAKVNESVLHELFPLEDSLYAAALNFTDVRNLSAYFAGDAGRGWTGLYGWVELMRAVPLQPRVFEVYTRMCSASGDQESAGYDWVTSHREVCYEVIDHAVETGIADGTMDPDIAKLDISHDLLGIADGVGLHWIGTEGRIDIGGAVQDFVELLEYRYGVKA